MSEASNRERAAAIVEQAYREALARAGVSPPECIDPDQVLLRSGLDSMGFAVLVTQLEDRLGYDPFLLSPEPLYPRTWSELVAVYQQYAEHLHEEGRR